MSNIFDVEFYEAVDDMKTPCPALDRNLNERNPVLLSIKRAKSPRTDKTVLHTWYGSGVVYAIGEKIGDISPAAIIDTPEKTMRSRYLPCR